MSSNCKSQLKKPSNCPNYGHSFQNNLHGPDQNEAFSFLRIPKYKVLDTKK